MPKSPKWPVFQRLKDSYIYPMEETRNVHSVRGGVVHPDIEDRFQQLRTNPNTKGFKILTNTKYLNAQHTKQKRNVKSYKGRYVYGGPLIWHFGHFIAECSHRMFAYEYIKEIEKRNIEAVVFVYFRWNKDPIARKLNDLASFQQQVISYFGIPEDKVLLVNEPSNFERLIVPKQSSTLYMRRKTSPDYLKFLRRFETLNQLGEDRDAFPSKLYVSRSNFFLKGTVAGQAYVEEIFKKAGFTIYHPEKCTILDQLKHFRNAEKIIFVEGSAMHTMELLSRVRADIYVINRRPNADMFFEKFISERAKGVTFLPECAALPAIDTYATGTRNTESSLTVSTDVDTLIAFIEKASPTAAKLFDVDMFRQAEAKDFKRFYVDTLAQDLPFREDSVKYAKEFSEAVLKIENQHIDRDFF